MDVPCVGVGNAGAFCGTRALLTFAMSLLRVIRPLHASANAKPIGETRRNFTPPEQSSYWTMVSIGTRVAEQRSELRMYGRTL
jgi:hypothetical protein